jgi:hypothetical protein
MPKLYGLSGACGLARSQQAPTTGARSHGGSRQNCCGIRRDSRQPTGRFRRKSHQRPTELALLSPTACGWTIVDCACRSEGLARTVKTKTARARRSRRFALGRLVASNSLCARAAAFDHRWCYEERKYIPESSRSFASWFPLERGLGPLPRRRMLDPCNKSPLQHVHGQM